MAVLSNSAHFDSAPAAEPHGGGALDRAIVLLASRLQSVLGEERAHLLRGEFSALDSLIERKSMLALDLGRLANQPCISLSEGARQTIRGVRTLLDENSVLLREHIDAVGEISRIIADTLQVQDSDGTYSETAGRGRFERC